MENIVKFELDINNYLDSIIYTYGINKSKQKIKNLLERNVPKELDNYSPKVIALLIEKKIFLAVETNLANRNQSCWRLIKINPLIFKKNKEIIEDFIELFIFNYDEENKIETLNTKDINNFYDKKIERAISKTIRIPNKRTFDFDDLIASSKKLFSNNEHKIIFNIKKSIVITATVASILSVGAKEKEENILSSYEYKIDKKEEKISSSYEYKVIEEEDLVSSEELTYVSEFVGYDNKLPFELQKYMYDLSIKYDVPFQVLMTVSHVESGGEFDTNGVVSSTNDYGLMQINECNIDYISDTLGFSKEEILNDPYKNIEASALLLKNIYTNNDITEVGEVFGIYNGWVNWKEKNISLEYVSKSLEVYSIYDEQEIFFVSKSKNK